MHKYSCRFLLFLFLALPVQIVAQAVYLPTGHEVYPFLKRMEAKQLLRNYRDDVKPLSRLTLAEYLHQLEAKSDQLTDLDRSELIFLKGEFAIELARLDTAQQFYEPRWNLFEADLHGGQLVANVVVQGRSRSSEGEIGRAHV